MEARQGKGLQNRVEQLKEKIRILKGEIKLLKAACKESEGKVREIHQLIEELPSGVVVVQGGKIVYVNEQIKRDSGYSEEEILSHEFAGFVHPDSIGKVRKLHQKRTSGKYVPERYEAYFRTKSGEKLLCEVKAKRIKYGKRNAFLFTLNGLDERKREEKLSCAVQKKEAIQRMARGLSREVEGLLASLDGATDPAKGPETGSKELLKIKEKTSALRNRLALLAKVTEPGDASGLFDLGSAVREAVAAIDPVLEARGKELGAQIRLKTYLRSITPIEGNREDIKQALVNLLLNAVEAFTEAGEIFLTTEQSAGFAHLYIQDTGVGIPEEIIEKIFDPFFTTKRGRRSGLGLALARAIVERHKGDIEMISRPGEGTSFTVRLPVPRRSLRASLPVKKGTIRDSQILFIATEGLFKDLLTRFFWSKGGKVTDLSSGPQALKLLGKRRFDLVVLQDEVLYGPPGRMISRIKKEAGNLPVVLVCCHEGGECPQGAQRAGADLVVQRPLNLKEVLSSICETMARRTRTDGGS